MDIIIGSASLESVRKKFHCKNGHDFTADRATTVSAYGAPKRTVCPLCVADVLVELCGAEEVGQVATLAANTTFQSGAGTAATVAALPVAVTMGEVLARRAKAQEEKAAKPAEPEVKA